IMAIFQLVLLLLLGGVGLSLLAPRLGVPWPALLALAGAGLALVPGMPEIRLVPGLALALFVAPVLLDSAYDTSLRDLRDNWAPVGSLVLVAVGLTIAAVAIIARTMEPGMGWAAAIALGAIVAPPDAAAATAVLRQVRLPHRLVVILEGESLLNDASALLAYKAAIAAAMGAALGGWGGVALVAEAGGGLLLGYILARFYFVMTRRVVDEAPAVVLQFLGTFGTWAVADALGLSAVLTVVAYAVTIARFAPLRTDGRRRRASYAVWNVVVFVLNVLAFILIGLQLRGIVIRLTADLWHYAAFAATVLGVVIAVRAAWVLVFNAAVRWKVQVYGMPAHRPMLRPTFAGGVAIAWCGMRGIVTLAAALALPEAFPQRDLIVFTAFAVVLGTLVVQG
ncbi:MAG: sodium:proton antiporter, partial [Oxalobacteraceae bacterium]